MNGPKPRSTDESKAEADPATRLTIDVVSDVICPWCFIGKRRLETALSQLGNPPSVRVIWRPFQLNPQMPAQGIERRAYRTAKFGNWERSQALDAQVAAEGAAEGIHFAFDKMVRTPNSLDAHWIIGLARSRGVQNATVETLFQAYFEDGLDLNDAATLTSLAASCGILALNEKRDEGRAAVLREEARYKGFGVNGVPSYFFNGRYAFSGAVDAATLAEAIRKELQASEAAKP